MMSWSAVWAVGRHPELWGEAVRAVVAVAPRGWWRTAPFLPRSDEAYLSWRTATARGAADADIEPAELVAYLQWRRRQHRPFRRV